MKFKKVLSPGQEIRIAKPSTGSPDRTIRQSQVYAAQ